MPNVFSKRLGWRLILLTLAATVPAMTIAVIILGRTASNHLRDDAVSKLARTAKSLAEKVSNWSDESGLDIGIFAHNPDITSMDPPRQRRALQLLMRSYSRISYTHIIGPNGINTARADDRPLLDYNDRSYFRRVMAGEPIVRETIPVSRSMGTPSLNYAVPILAPADLPDPGGTSRPAGSSTAASQDNRSTGKQKVLGVLVMGMELSQLAAVVHAVRYGQTGYSCVVDAEGRALAHPDLATASTLRDLSNLPPVREAIEHRDSRSCRFQDDQGVWWLAYSVPLETGWSAISFQQEAEALAPAQSMFRLSLLLMGATIAVMVLGAWLASRCIARPLARMKATADQIAGGDWNQRISEDRQDELGSLARAFNRMVSELRQMYRSVEEKVAQRTKELSDANGNLQAQIEERQQEILRRKQAEETVQKSEEKYRTLVNNLTVGVFRIAGDSDGTLLQANPALATMLGYASIEEFREIPVGDHYLNPLDRTGFVKEIARAGFVRDKELHLKRKDGVPLWAAASASAHYDSPGHVDWIDGTIEDITERKQVVADLDRERKNLAAIFEASPMGLLLMDENATVTAVNNVAEKPAGKTAAEMIRVQPGDALGCFHALDMGCGKGPFCPSCPIRAAVEGTLASGRSARGLEIQAVLVIGGTQCTIWLEISVEPVTIDGKRHALASLVNITERKLAEEALRLAQNAAKSENAKLSAMISGMEEGVVFANADNVVVEINDFLCRFAGKTREEIVGRRLADIHRGSVWQNIQAQVKRFREETNSGPYVLQRSLGPAEVILRMQPIYRDGAYDGVLLNVIDVTELVQARQAAEVASAAKGEFLANMSHEIRTPMTAILGYTDLVAEAMLDCCGRCPAYAGCKACKANTERLAIIHRNGKHLLDLINDILDLSKIEAGKMDAEIQPCQLMPLVADVASIMRVKARQKGIDLAIECGSAIPQTILTDAARLRQAMVNLVGNAIKFTHRGGVRIVLNFLPCWKNDWAAVQFQVVDTGIGIAEEKLANLFKPFAQADASTSRKYGGTGLGLAISRHIAEILGGELTVQSELDKGSTFTVTIPVGSMKGVVMLPKPSEALNLAEADQTEKNPCNRTSRPRPTALAGLKILLAEDGADNQLLIQALLQAAGAVVEVADNGQIAVDKALAANPAPAGEGFDVVLMDIQMPVMDGYTACRRLRKAGYHRPIIALTAHAMLTDRAKCLDAGCDDYLTKPIDRGDLIAAILRHAIRPDPATSAGDNSPPADAPAPALADAPPAGSGETDDNTGEVRSLFADDASLTDVMDRFVAGLPARAEAMQNALAAAHWEELVRLAHQMKGAGGSYGYPALTEISRTLEFAARNQDAEGAHLALADWMRLCEAIARGRPGAVCREEPTA